MLTYTVHFETSSPSICELFSKNTTSRSNHFPNQFNIIGFKSNTGRNTLQYRGSVTWNFFNRLVKVPGNLYSYKQILKKHVRGIAEFSFSKKATLITAKKMILYTFKLFLTSGIIISVRF